MRQIKFRAWDGRRMHQPHISITSEGLDIHGDTTKAKHLELMQFTGLFDRNGVEIYEGDIVMVELINDNERWIVSWGNGMWLMSWPDVFVSEILSAYAGGDD
jgi:hypothetical protein